MDLGPAVGARQALDHLGSVLLPGETPLCGATAFLEGRSGLVVATTTRLLFIYKDETPIDSPYREIKSVRAKSGAMAAELEIVDGDGRAVIKQVHPRSRLVPLSAIIHRALSGADPSQAPQLPHIRAAQDPETGDGAPWRPKLRPKVEPLAPHRPSAPAPTVVTAPVSAPAAVRGGAITVDARERPTGWRPRFGDGAGREAPSPVPITRIAADGASPGAPRDRSWLERGEWILSTFPLAPVPGGPAEAVVTNRRLILVSADGGVAGRWPVAEVRLDPVDGVPGMLALAGHGSLELNPTEQALDLLHAVRKAVALAMAEVSR